MSEIKVILKCSFPLKAFKGFKGRSGVVRKSAALITAVSLPLTLACVHSKPDHSVESLAAMLQTTPGVTSNDLLIAASDGRLRSGAEASSAPDGSHFAARVAPRRRRAHEEQEILLVIDLCPTSAAEKFMQLNF